MSGTGTRASPVWQERRRASPLRDAWEGAVRDHAGKLTGPRGLSGFLLRGESLTLSATVDGVAVVAVTWPDGDGATEITAAADGVDLAPLALSPGRPGFLARLRGWRAAGVLLAKRFAVRCEDDGAQRAWLSREVADWSAIAGYHIAAGHGSVRTWRRGVEHDTPRLDAALRATAALARRHGDLAAAWERVATALGGQGERLATWRSDGSAAITLEGPPRTVLDYARLRLDGGSGARRLYTRVRVARVGERTDRFALYPASSSDQPDGGGAPQRLDGTAWVGAAEDRLRLHARVVDGHGHAALRDLALAAVIGAEDRIVVVLPGLELDIPRLRSAAALAARLAVEVAPGRGPYR